MREGEAGLARARGSDADDDERNLAERVRLMCVSAASAQLVVALASAVVVVVFWDVAPRTVALSWLALTWLVAGLRAALAIRYVAVPGRCPAEARRWARVVVALVALAGAGWGAAILVFYPYGSTAHQLFVTIVVGGMAAGSSVVFASHLPTFYTFAVPTLLPMAARLLLEPDLLHRAAGLLLLLFGLVLATIAFSGARTIGRALRLRNRNDALVEHLRHEIAERELATRALAESEDLFRTLSERAMLGVYLIQDGRFRYVNPRLAEMYGCATEELASGAEVREFVHPDDRERVKESIRGRLEGERASDQYEFRGLRRNGSSFLVEVYGSATRYRGRPAIVGTALDVTERRKSEQELLRLEKLESLGVLAGGIAHDFNNLLAVVLGDLSLARHDVGPDTSLAELLEEAEQATLRARDLTSQLLTFAKGGAPQKRPLALSTLARQAATFAARGSRAACHFELSDDLWPVEADAGQLTQVVHNLVLNAVQAMPEGGRITVSTANVEGGPDSRCVRLEVHDEGVGISPQLLHKVFDPYFTTKQSGTGLGLASAFSIVKRHGGTLGVQSQPGHGATFTMLLPAADVRPEPAPRPTRPRSGRGRVLFMDDEELVRRAAERMLKRLGYEVVLARDGAEAVELFAQSFSATEPIEAAILDLTVPGGMGGKLAAPRLRALSARTRLIASSGYSSDAAGAEYAACGFDAFLPKPYRLEQLGEVLLPAGGAPPVGRARSRPHLL